MANTELEKTIEELEAEVLSELEEANGDPSAPTKSAVPAEKMEKGKSNSEDAPMQDTGKAVVEPNSLPILAIFFPIEFNSSVGKGPLPTLVE